MKVIHFVNLSGIGGVQTAFISYYDYLRQEGLPLERVYGTREIDKEYYDVENYNVLRFNALNWFMFFYFILSRKYIIHFHNGLVSKKINLLLKVIMFPSNVVFHEHGMAWSATNKNIFKSNARHADKIIANSNACKIILNSHFGILKEKIVVIYYGFENVHIVENKPNIKFTVGFIGRFDAIKGLHILIEASKNIPRALVDFKIAGDGPLKEYFLNKSQGVKNVSWIGRVSNPIEFISSLDVLVIPSIREPLGIIAIEAGLCGTPVIAADVDGLPEVVELDCGTLLKPLNSLNEKLFNLTGEIVPSVVVNPTTLRLEKPREIDPEDLSRSILEIMENYAAAKKKSVTLNKHVVKTFTKKNYYDAVRLVYSSLIV